MCGGWGECGCVVCVNNVKNYMCLLYTCVCVGPYSIVIILQH